MQSSRLRKFAVENMGFAHLSQIVTQVSFSTSLVKGLHLL